MNGAEIPAGMTIRGEVEVQGDLVVAGRIEGRVRVGGSLRVEAGGFVEARVQAARAQIGGEVKGDVVATQAIHLLSGCRVEGELRAPRLDIEEGAVVRGRVEPGAAADASAPAPADRTEGPPPMPASALAMGDRRKRIVVPPPVD